VASPPIWNNRPFVSWVQIKETPDVPLDRFPFTLPSVRALQQRVNLHPGATFFIGENGSGKSTIVEALAVALGYNAEGGSKNFGFATRSSESELHRFLRVARTERRPRTGFFLRAESFYNVATNIEVIDRESEDSHLGGPPVIDSYGGKSLHEQSHGESFMALVRNRFGSEGLYFLDEPEAALSPLRQVELLLSIHELVNGGSQFVIATHSPLLMALPNARIYELSGTGLRTLAYRETEHFQLMKRFFESPEGFVQNLIAKKR
jgi:predicted ATPase